MRPVAWTARREGASLLRYRCVRVSFETTFTLPARSFESEKRGEVREHGQIANTPEALRKLTSQLARAGRELKFCYEAGPCGYGIQRQLTAAGHSCVVVAPSSAGMRGDTMADDDTKH